MNKRFVFGAVAALSLAGMASARPDLAHWTFENSVPASAGPHTPESGFFAGISGAFANTGGTISNPVGNGSFESMSSNSWNIGDNFEFRTSTVGFQNILVSWDQTSSGTGPLDFDLEISTNGGGSYTSVQSYDSLFNGAPNNFWSSGGARELVYNTTVLLSAAANNLADLRIRLTNTSTVSANGGTVAGTGTSRVDNVQISGFVIPTPGAIALVGVAGLVGIRRRRA